MEASGVRIHHPNREKAASKATKAVVIVLLIASAALIALVLIGGWTQMAGAELLAIVYVLVYVAMAFFVARWNRGVLPLAAGLAVFFIAFAAVAAPAWLARAEPGLEDPLLPSELLGLLTFVIIAVQALLVVFAMRGFQQRWNVEIEQHDDGSYDDGGYDYSYEQEPAPQR
jgi:protein-S-isoprenylcysteine O-methyltransferase Ste14